MATHPTPSHTRCSISGSAASQETARSKTQPPQNPPAEKQSAKAPCSFRMCRKHAYDDASGLKPKVLADCFRRHRHESCSPALAVALPPAPFFYPGCHSLFSPSHARHCENLAAEHKAQPTNAEASAPKLEDLADIEEDLAARAATTEVYHRFRTAPTVPRTELVKRIVRIASSLVIKAATDGSM